MCFIGMRMSELRHSVGDGQGPIADLTPPWVVGRVLRNAPRLPTGRFKRFYVGVGHLFRRLGFAFGWWPATRKNRCQSNAVPHSRRVAENAPYHPLPTQ